MEERKPPTITVNIEPDFETLTIPRPKTVQQLLNRFGLRPTDCLVIREPMEEGEERRLLTQDLAVEYNAVLTIRKVMSSG